jgi:hypothetical protein
MQQQASRVVLALSQQVTVEAKRLCTQAQQVLPLVAGVIAQTRSRVLEGKKVPSEQKVLSLFEPHTRAIPRSPWRGAGRIWATGDAGRGGRRHRHPLRDPGLPQGENASLGAEAE